MFKRRLVVSVAAAVLVAAVSASVYVQARAVDRPETVMVTLRARAGADGALAEVIARHFETARKLALLSDQAPHVTLRGTDADNRTYFVEIFTWRDVNIPDGAPAAIQAIWKEMNSLVEPRNGRPGLEFSEMTMVAP